MSDTSSKNKSNNKSSALPEDWSSFRFPPRPNSRFDLTDDVNEVFAPVWAAPPILIISWHFDPSKKVIVHPVLKKRIDLDRLSTLNRLVMLAKTILEQPNDIDAISLWRALDAAALYSFGETLPELLASKRVELIWSD